MALRKVDFDSYSPRQMTKIKLKNLNTADLKAYMKRAYNLSDDAFSSTNEQLRKSINIVGNKLGTKFRKGEQSLKRVYGNREEMLKNAELLRSHLAIDVFTNTATEDFEEISQEVKDKINSVLGSEMSDMELNAYWFVFHEVKNLSAGFGSTDVNSMLEDAFGGDDEESKRSAVDILLMIKEEYEKIQGKGLDTKQFIKRIKKRFSESF